MQLRISFKDIFPDETPKAKFEEYLVGIEKSILLRVATDLISKGNHQISLEKWFDSSAKTMRDNFIYADIELRFSKFAMKNQEMGFINRISSLRFFEYLLPMEDNNSVSILSNFQQKLQIFQAYLWLNEQQNENEKKFIESIKKSSFFANKSTFLILPTQQFGQNYNDPYLPAFLLGQNFHSYYINNYEFRDVLYAQIVKACELFQFLESRQDLKLYLTKFLENTKSKTWEDYLRKFLPLIRHKNEFKSALLVIEEADIREFIADFVLQADDTDTDKDFRAIRAKPIFKDLKKENTYHIVFELFLLEKMYSVMFFTLKDIDKQLLKTGEAVKLNRKGEEEPFKSFYGSEFVEKWLLYKMLENIFSNLDFKFEKGNNLTFEGEPDFYALQGENVYLFECKDTLVNAEVKHSYDFLEIEKEIKKKLYWKQGKTKQGEIKEESKAIRQLLNNAERILSNFKEFKFDKEDKKIYPIVVVDSQSINSLGVNSLLRHWFDEELTALKKAKPDLKWQNVRPIVLVDMDTFILYQTALANGSLVLHQLLDKYIEFTTLNVEEYKMGGKELLEQHYLDVVKPFSFFMQERYSNFITLDKLKEYGKLLFTDDDNV